MPSRRSSPTVKRRRVALTLRELRERTGMTAAEAGRRANHDGSWLGRIEKAEVYCHPNNVEILLRLYGVEGRQAQAVLAVARQAKSRGWWHSYRDAIPADFSTYVGLENDAILIRKYDTMCMPGLLQTEPYARALIEASLVKARRSEIDRLVALRMDRQALLEVDDPPELRIVLDEAVVRREVGGPKVMRDQITHLIEAADRWPNIKLMLLPFGRGAHAGIDGPFLLLEFDVPPEGYPDTTDPRVVYVESLTGAMYLERPDEISAYAAAWDGLCNSANPIAVTLETLRTIALDL